MNSDMCLLMHKKKNKFSTLLLNTRTFFKCDMMMKT